MTDAEILNELPIQNLSIQRDREEKEKLPEITDTLVQPPEVAAATPMPEETIDYIYIIIIYLAIKVYYAPTTLHNNSAMMQSQWECMLHKVALRSFMQMCSAKCPMSYYVRKVVTGGLYRLWAHSDVIMCW